MVLSLECGVSTPDERSAARLQVEIRLAQLADLEALVALEQAAFTMDRAERRAIRHAIRSPSMTLLVAVARDEAEETAGQDEPEILVGAATIERRRTSRVARLSSLAVAPARAGAGLGRRLLLAAEADARAHGCERLRLEVRADNGGGIRLYERGGYARYGIKTDYYEDGMEAWCYEKALNASE
ncbi:GNAT family N-acetyltransferase [Methylorubrum zatmanii]|uniref:GNAT family N-acetyltransferase n=1 Tax=Methylorubrum zatmanii TaxID=29429 RepID=A0ABW1WVI5_9HYPH|nr:N-acetyltransferase [Methylorubrum zatmanii]MBD8905167.1 GNAT family N-acetyltransferase [Methylorubrum zatmanii]